MDLDTALGRYVGKENVPAVKEKLKYFWDPVVEGVSNPARPVAKRLGIDGVPEKNKDLDGAQDFASSLLSDHVTEKAVEKIGGGIAAGAAWNKLPKSLKTALGAVAGVSAIATNTLPKNMIKQLPSSIGKGTIAQMNKQDETGDEQEAVRIGAFTGITENIGDATAETIVEKMNFGNSWKDKLAKFTIRTLLSGTVNELQNEYEERNDN